MILADELPLQPLNQLISSRKSYFNGGSTTGLGPGLNEENMKSTIVLAVTDSLLP